MRMQIVAVEQKKRVFYSAEEMEALFLMLDQLHDAASAGELSDVTPMTAEQMTGWLREIIYTARETIVEIERHTA